jgi:hypothetical protein
MRRRARRFPAPFEVKTVTVTVAEQSAFTDGKYDRAERRVRRVQIRPAGKLTPIDVEVHAAGPRRTLRRHVAPPVGNASSAVCKCPQRLKAN